MRYIYVNRSSEPKTVTLVSENKNNISKLTLIPNEVYILSYPGLDMYVPHLLCRLDSSGADISKIIARQKIKESSDIKIEISEKPVEDIPNNPVEIIKSTDEVIKPAKVSKQPAERKIKHKK